MRSAAGHVLLLSIAILRVEDALPQTRQTAPVLAFPEAGVDDITAYQGYQTRFFRDSRGNTVQIYLDPRGGRAVNLWADAYNESVGFTIRDSTGLPARLAWGSEGAVVTDSGATRTVEYDLRANAPRVEIGWLLLGSMRVERDLQYSRRHLEPFGTPTFRQPELEQLLSNLQRLSPVERGRHLRLLRARNISEVRVRMRPVISAATRGATRTVSVVQPSFDGQNRMALALSVDAREATAVITGHTISIRSRSGDQVRLKIRISTDAQPLAALSRDSIFNAEFLGFLASARSAHDSVGKAGGSRAIGDSARVARYQWLERQVRGVELLSTKEKLMAGLPNYATYFGRDMMMTALMMEPVWSHAMAEHVIASVLRKLSPTGQVSHEEALGGQAIRENAAEYNALVAEYFRLGRSGSRAQRALERARLVLGNLHAVRENYNMLDDEFQLPVLAARYLGNPAIPAARKRSFLMDSAYGGVSRLALLLREMALVARMAGPYTQSPTAQNLVSFPKRDSTRWFPGSWRDSGAGYANGRFAMDINAIWVPNALHSISVILAQLDTLGFSAEQLGSLAPDMAGTPLGSFARDRESLRRAEQTWSGAVQHFVVRVSPAEIRARASDKLRSLPKEEREYWEGVLRASGADADSLAFLALSLDADARPIPVVNSDPATWLFLHDRGKYGAAGGDELERTVRDVRTFLRPYPVGLFVQGLGPLVANDVYASPAVWEAFREDLYHSPRVVWGREVNLFMLGVAKQITASHDEAGRLRDPALAPYERELGDALRRIATAVEGSGLKHNELWSYQIEGGRLLPIRYGASTDIQLWNVTDLAVQFVLARLPRR